MYGRIEKPVFHKDEYREQSPAEAEETLRLALRDANLLLTPLQVLSILRDEVDLSKAKKQLSNLEKGKYEY